jgi:hypothetical protein
VHPKARTPLTVEAKTAAVAKRNATRAARHTAGSKQKMSVKGAVTGIVVTPVTAKETVATAAPSDPTAPATSTGTMLPGRRTPPKSVVTMREREALLRRVALPCPAISHSATSLHP